MNDDDSDTQSRSGTAQGAGNRVEALFAPKSGAFVSRGKNGPVRLRHARFVRQPGRDQTDQDKRDGAADRFTARACSGDAGRHGCPADHGGKHLCVCLHESRRDACLRSRRTYGDAARHGENSLRDERPDQRRGPLPVPARGGAFPRRGGGNGAGRGHGRRGHGHRDPSVGANGIWQSGDLPRSDDGRTGYLLHYHHRQGRARSTAASDGRQHCHSGTGGHQPAAHRLSQYRSAGQSGHFRHPVYRRNDTQCHPGIGQHLRHCSQL